MRMKQFLVAVLAVGFLAAARVTALAQSRGHDRNQSEQHNRQIWWDQKGTASQYHLFTDRFWQSEFGSESQSPRATSSNNQQATTHPWSVDGSWSEHWSPSWNDHWDDAWGEKNVGRTGGQTRQGRSSDSSQKQNQSQDRDQDQR